MVGWGERMERKKRGERERFINNHVIILTLTLIKTSGNFFFLCKV